MLVTMPRIILSEFNTHRVFSRNTSSSRAIPFERMVNSIEENPFIPIAFQKDHSGMQGMKYLTDIASNQAEIEWIRASKSAIREAKILNDNSVTKQLCNRLLEPFMYTIVIVTSTEWQNFFALRCPKYELHIKNPGIFYKSKKNT